MKNTYDPDQDDRTQMDLPDAGDDLSSPIGRLMSDEEEVIVEEDTLVSGFDRNQPEDAPPPERRRARRPQPAVDPDEDFFETGIREARAGRERDRRRQPNPDPRPATRATVPTHKRMPRRNEDEFHPLDTPPEDKYDTFRQRYNPDDLISSGRGSRPPRKGAPPPREGAPARRGYDSDNSGGGNTSMLRMVALGGIFVLLLILVIMTVNRNSLNRRYNEAAERIESMEAAYAENDALRRQVSSMEAEQLADSIRIAELETQLASLTNSGGEQVAGNQAGAENGAEEAAPGQGDFPRQHEVERGQLLTAIARLHYGDGTATENHLRALFIADYNNVNADNVPAGTILTIPALP